MKFFKRLRVILSVPNRHEIVTKILTWIELCQNAVFKKNNAYHHDNDTQVFRDFLACH